MGKMQRRKGAAGERELINKLKESGVPAKRISMMETNHEDKGDIEVMGVYKGEVKRGNHVPKFYSQSIKGSDFLFSRRDREGWKVTMDLEFFLEKFV